MRRYRAVTAIIAVLLFVLVVWAAPKDSAGDPKELITRAQKLQDLWAGGTPPLLLHGEVQIWDRKGNPAKGEYTYNWASPSRWREHIHFVNYDRLRVGDAGGYWQKRNPDFEPEIIFELERVLNTRDALMIGSKQTLGKVKPQQENGKQLLCTDVKWPSATEKTLCFDEARGTLDSVEYHKLEGRHAPEITRLEFDKFAPVPVGDKIVPHEVRALFGTSMVASLKILELTETPQTDPALFDPPEDAVHWAACKEVQGRDMLSSDPPIYPPGAKAKLEQGRVIYYAVIEGDGSISHAKLIQGATPALDSVTLSTLDKWRYKPAACGQTPVRTETAIEMDFWLGG